jgi:hypothetical protein
MRFRAYLASVASRIRARRSRVAQLLDTQASGRIGVSYAARTTSAALLAFLTLVAASIERRLGGARTD